MRSAASVLHGCFGPDMLRLRGRLRRLGTLPREERTRAFERIVADAEVSRRLVEARRISGPAPGPAADLPIAASAPALEAAIRTHPVIVVCGETGSGKSTQLPRICLAAGRGRQGWIGHTQPRRIAARAVAARVAEELGTPLGADVGYKVRFGDRTRRETYVKVMTDGVLLAELAHDPQLLAYDTIIIDEAHERSLNIDFLLGCLRRIVDRRPDLRIIITSATIDPKRFSAAFDDAPVFEIPGRTYPVDIEWRPVPGDPDEVDPAMQGVIGDEVLRALEREAPGGSGDILIFLSGEREIRTTAETLRKRPLHGAEIVPLYARLSLDEQARIFSPGGRRRIVLATNVAETSLTVPRIRTVIDPGLARISRYSGRSKVQRLPIEPISQASARQRAGRCGRVGPGVCVRLYDERSFERRETFTPPEILRTNLASVILRMLALDLGRPEAFPFLDRPGRALLRAGYETLHEIGALDASMSLTSLGRRLADLPVDPRLGAMLLAAEQEGALPEVLIIASALAVADPRDRPLDARDAADAAHRAFAHDRSDFLSLLRIWEAYTEVKAHLSQNRLRAWCRERYLSFLRMREWVDLHGQLHGLLAERRIGVGEAAARTADRGQGPGRSTGRAGYAAIHRSILRGLLSNVGRQGERNEYKGARGQHFVLHPSSSLVRARPRWVMAAEIVETRRRYARCAAQIHPEWVELAGRHLAERVWTDAAWDARRGRVIAMERVTILGLDVVERRRVDYGRVEPAIAREIFIQQALVQGELGADLPFLAHNRRLVEEIRAMEAKRRRRDVLVDPARQFAFYDRRLPRRLTSRGALERWCLARRRRDPEALFMQRGDLVEPAAGDLDASGSPDFLLVGGRPARLTYRLDPGADDDGVTLTLPLAHLADLPAERPEWIVPSLLPEKVVALLRALPRDLRRELVPLPERAREAVAALPFGDGNLLAALTEVVHRQTGVRIPPDAWNPAALPAHLRLRIVVEDAEGRVLGAGRDIVALRDQLEDARRRAIEAMSEAVLPTGRFRDWSFGDLPEVLERTEVGGRVTGYPAILDEGTGVSLSLRADAAEAQRLSHAGVRRLLWLRLEEEITEQLSLVPAVEAIRRLAAALPVGLPVHGSIDSQVGLLIVDSAVLDGRPAVRSSAAFEAALDDAWPRLWRTTCTVAERVQSILEAWALVTGRLADHAQPIWSAAVADIAAHLRDLLHPGFLVETPPARLAGFPRLLQAIAVRLERLHGGGHVRDAGHARLIARCRDRIDALQGRVDVDPRRREALRWMLEETRVLLFAPALASREALPIQRLEREIAAVECGSAPVTMPAR
ncbi:MAG: ATP-dependent RNA helicase HrpA [Phycisphaeraceae bacterium]|nr:ATP-dependent RNA helicase HrpA [Phycisphaeraceae bacterium]